MATTSHNTAETTIAVPRAYQDFLVAGRDRFICTCCVAFAGLPLMNSSTLQNWFGKHILDLSPLVLGVVIWAFERKRKWRYVLTDEMITTTWASGNGWMWEWRTIFWKRTPVTGVERTEWRGFPAIRLIGGKWNRKKSPDWLIVYAHEDTELIETAVLPLIEIYQGQYGQDTWV